jgi:hypothetical protein
MLENSRVFEPRPYIRDIQWEAKMTLSKPRSHANETTRLSARVLPLVQAKWSLAMAREKTVSELITNHYPWSHALKDEECTINIDEDPIRRWRTFLWFYSLMFVIRWGFKALLRNHINIRYWFCSCERDSDGVVAELFHMCCPCVDCWNLKEYSPWK